MRLASVYLYVSDMKMEARFWSALLQKEPVASSDKWSEFSVGDARIGLLLDEESIKPVQSTAAFVLEVEDKELDDYIARAQAAEGSIVMQGLSNRIIMASPSGHHFELSISAPVHSERPGG
jgi:predicted enzyme related to lactoylglutathione lyase